MTDTGNDGQSADSRRVIIIKLLRYVMFFEAHLYISRSQKKTKMEENRQSWTWTCGWEVITIRCVGGAPVRDHVINANKSAA